MRHPTLTSAPAALVAAGLLLSLCGCGAVADYFAGDDNVEPPAELVEFEPEFQPRVVWSRRVGTGPRRQYLKLRPAVAGETVYAAGRKGDVSAFRAENGERVWETSAKAAISGGPGVGGGQVVVGTTDGEIIALEAESGALLWRTQLSSEVLSGPLSADGVVVARTTDGKLYGLSAADGSRIWVYDQAVPVLSLRGTSNPILAGDTVVAGFDSGRMVALTLRRGQPLWEQRVATPAGRSELERLVDIDADPVVYRDAVYAATFQGQIAAFDLGTGSLLWRRDMSAHAGLAADRRHLYVSDESSHVWALDRRTSASVWRQKKLQARRVSGPLAFGEYVIVGDLDGYVHWLRRDDGQFVARLRVAGNGIIAPPVANADTVFVYDRGGSLSAVRVE